MKITHLPDRDLTRKLLEKYKLSYEKLEGLNVLRVKTNDLNLFDAWSWWTAKSITDSIDWKKKEAQFLEDFINYGEAALVFHSLLTGAGTYNTYLD